MGVTTMKVFLLLGLAALASGAPRAAKLLKNPRSTPLSRGGGKIVGGEDAYYGEFPHQIMLLRGGPDGSLMCGGSLISSDWVVLLPIAVMVSLLPDLELLLVPIISTLMMLTRRIFRFPRLLCTKAMMIGMLRMTSVFCNWNLLLPWDLTLEPLAFLPRMKNMLQEPCVPLLDGEPPLRVAALPEYFRRLMYLLSVMMTVEMPMDLAKLLTL